MLKLVFFVFLNRRYPKRVSGQFPPTHVRLNFCVGKEFPKRDLQGSDEWTTIETIASEGVVREEMLEFWSRQQHLECGEIFQTYEIIALTIATKSYEIY